MFGSRELCPEYTLAKTAASSTALLDYTALQEGQKTRAYRFRGFEIVPLLLANSGQPCTCCERAVQLSQDGLSCGLRQPSHPQDSSLRFFFPQAIVNHPYKPSPPARKQTNNHHLPAQIIPSRLPKPKTALTMTAPRVRLILSIDGTNSTEWGVLDSFGGENCALNCDELLPLLMWRAGTINGVLSSVRRIHDMVKEGIVTDANGIQYDQVYLISTEYVAR